MSKGQYGNRGTACTIEGCGKPNFGRGLCMVHYAEKRRRDAGVKPRPNAVKGTYGKPCTVNGCEVINKARGLCARHYQELRRRETGKPAFRPRQKCTVDGCDDRQHAKTFCVAHYQLAKRNGDPVSKRSKNGEGFTTPYGYRMVTVNGEQMAEHRAVMQAKLGRRLFRNDSVHHINGVRHDNRIENLELWSTFQPYGQRVADKLAWAREIIAFYG